MRTIMGGPITSAVHVSISAVLALRLLVTGRCSSALAWRHPTMPDGALGVEMPINKLQGLDGCGRCDEALLGALRLGRDPLARHIFELEGAYASMTR